MGSPEWTPALTYGLLLRQMYRINMSAIENALREAGTTLVQWAVLRSIGEHPGASGADLAAAAFVTPQALGQILGRLVDQSLVERRPGRGRSIEHYLTDAGWAHEAVGAAVVDAIHRDTLSPLTDDEIDQLVDLLHRLRDGHKVPASDNGT
jgi:DNA-binding MarR family transcriptional regulator